jgi:hypothetical protein
MPVYAGILQAASTVTVITRLVLRAKGQAGPLGLDDVRSSIPLGPSSTNPDILTGPSSSCMAGINRIHCLYSPQHREVW